MSASECKACYLTDIFHSQLINVNVPIVYAVAWLGSNPRLDVPIPFSEIEYRLVFSHFGHVVVAY